jgi:hypothetical protein
VKLYSFLPEEEEVEGEPPEESDEVEEPDAAEDVLTPSDDEGEEDFSPLLLDSPDFAAVFEPPLAA